MNPKKIRILQFTLAASRGGATQYILNLFEHIDRSKICFDFVTFSPFLDFEDALKAQGARVHHISVYPEADREKFEKEFNRILGYGYDAIEIHTKYWASTIVERLAKKAGIKKIIIHAHSTGINATLSEDAYRNALHRHYEIRDMLSEDDATDFWACSKATGEWLFGKNISSEKICVIKNTVDTEHFRFDKDARRKLRNKLGLENFFVAGVVCRLEPVKNLDFLFPIIKRLKDTGIPVKLIIVGQGSQWDRLHDEARVAEVYDDIVWAGFQKDVADYMNAMDILLMPSIFEGLPIAMLEALSAGLPCVISDRFELEPALLEEVHRLPLEEEAWERACVVCANGYERKSGGSLLKKLGYDTSSQIKLLEEKYLDHVETI